MRVWGNLLKFLDKRIDAFGAQYKAFGIFGVINYSSSYLILRYFGTQESGILRLTAFLLCIPLVFTEYWPVQAKKYLSPYWFLTILYCLPFFGTYMVLENQASLEWLMNVPTGLFLLILLVNWDLFLILLIAGMLLGSLAFIASGQEIVMKSNFSEIGLAAYIYCYAIIIGIVFARNHERTKQEKLQALKMMAGSVAHEMRTPFLGIRANAMALKKFLPTLISGYQKAKEMDLNVDSITSAHLEGLREIPDDLEKITLGASTVIDMLLMNLKDISNHHEFSPCSINDCVCEALQTYPLTEEERSLISWADSPDFLFDGNPLLMKHVLFNLLKNALYYVKAAHKGSIFLWTEITPKGNILYFKDTGKGIPASMLPYIFDRFYSRTRHGTGIGLAFCQSMMRNFGGAITCASTEGEHTTFTLKFPPLKKSTPV